MAIHIHTRGFELTESLERYTRRRIARGLAKYDESIGNTHVGLTDVNGPRGGSDKCCRVHIALPHQSDIVVKDTQPNMYNAIDRALRRAHRVLRKRIKKIHARSKGRRLRQGGPLWKRVHQ